MAYLDFGDTDAEALVVLKGFAQQINADFYGNGREGIMQRVIKFMESFASVEAERERQQKHQHEQNAEKLDTINSKLTRRGVAWTIAGVAVAIASAAIATLAIGVMIWLAHHAELTPQEIFHSEHHPVLSSVQSQDAGNPAPYAAMNK